MQGCWRGWRWGLLAGVMVLALAAPGLPGDAAADDSVLQEVADFQQQLESGLRARRPQEFAFIAVVVNHVEQGRLSREMVMGMFTWARERDFYRPFPHFQFGLRRRAAEVGVAL